MKKSGKRVLVFGCFDGLHEGHLDVFKRARKIAGSGQLVACVARDSTILTLKGCAPFFAEDARMRLVASLKPVNRAVLGGTGDKYLVVKNVRPDVIVLGFNQEVDVKKLREKIREFGLRTSIRRLRTGFKPGTNSSRVLRNWVEKAF